MSAELTAVALIKQLPRTMQLRFDALGGYVKAVVQEEQDSGRLEHALPPDKVAFIQLMTFVYALDTFLRDGSRAARGAVKIFEELGARGFEVGRALFVRGNENTERGEALANGIRAAIAGTRYSEILAGSSSMRDLVKKLIEEVRYEQPGLG